MTQELKKVLIISEVFYPEEFLINDVVKKWDKEGYNINILTRNPSYPFGKLYSGYKNRIYQKETTRNITVHRYHFFQGYNEKTIIKILNYLWNLVLSTIIVLIKFRKEKNIFIYHTGPLTIAFSAVILKKINKGKITIWTQDIWPDTIFAYGIKKNRILEKILQIYVKWIYKNCDKIVVSSPGFIKKINMVVDTEVKFVPNWANVDFLQSKEGNIVHDEDIFEFTFAGNIGKVQNLKTVIEAFSKWKKESTRFNIYGDGSELANLKKYVSLNEIENVIFWGRVPVTEMPLIYKRSDVLIISLEKDELFDLYLPAKFSTYLSSGKPILGIISGVVNKLIKENNIGFSCSPSNEVEIIEGLDNCYNLTNDQLERIENNSKSLFSEVFNAEKNIKILENIIFD